MGQAGSQPGGAGAGPGALPLRTRRAHTLPHEPLRHAPKVLPSLTESPRLRSTDNGAILHSGGTISGRRPVSNPQGTSRVPHGHVHSNAYRSRSANGGGETNEFKSRERDPLHRSHTNLDLRHQNSGNINKKFGSEPDLRVEEEEHKPRCTNKHFRKKYRAPPPPIQYDNHDGSSPDSSDGNMRIEPHKKLRLFKTRNETKQLNGPPESKLPTFRNPYKDFKSLDYTENIGLERRYKSPYKTKELHSKCPEHKDMVQSSISLRREEQLLQNRKEYKNSKLDRVSEYRAKTSKSNIHNDARKTPLLNRDFRYSERFRKEEFDKPYLRRERTFDDITTVKDKEKSSPKAIHQNRMKAIGDQLKEKMISPKINRKPIGKSLPSLLGKHSDEKDEFQLELKKATSRIRNELGNKNNVSENKTSHINKTNQQKLNPTKHITQNKVKESSLSSNVNNTKESNFPNRMPLRRLNEVKPKFTSVQNSKVNNSITNNNDKENGRTMRDRGQASGKESTPDHSPTRTAAPVKETLNEKQSSAPSKQFYFGMTESQPVSKRDNLKDFPGLGSPIIEEFTNFHLIEKKLLGYHEEDDELEKFCAEVKKETKNLSSESALSSEGSEGEGADGNMGIALRLRPAPPKRQHAVPRFSPNTAWKQLASLDFQLLAAQTQPLVVETKVPLSISPESSPRSEQSTDKSGDSGISGDHGISDTRIESPTRHHTSTDPNITWTPQQDLGDSSSDGAGGITDLQAPGLVTYNPGTQPFSLSLPRDGDDRGRQLQQGFNSLQKLKKSVSGALGAALGSRRFDIEHEPMLEEPEQNWFLTKSAPNSLSNPLLLHQPILGKGLNDDEEDIPLPSLEKDNLPLRHKTNSYVSWGGHRMYLPPAPTAQDQPLSLLGPLERPVRSKSSGSLEVAARAARAAALAGEMRERERSASPDVARALPATVEPSSRNSSNNRNRGKRFTFQSTVRQLERRKLAEKLSKEADLKEQQRRTELEAMRRVEEEFQRKRAREKANIRQQLRLVSSGASSMPHSNHKTRDEPDGSYRGSPAPDRARDGRHRHSNTSSEISARSKSSTPVRCIESGTRMYVDWGTAAHAHPPACARMPKSTHVAYNAPEVEAFSGSPRSDNYRLEFARGRSPRSPRSPHSPLTPRAPRLLPAARTPSSSGSELSIRQPIKIRCALTRELTVAFDNDSLGSGGAAVPKQTSRSCVACDYRAKLSGDNREPATAPPVLLPTLEQVPESDVLPLPNQSFTQVELKSRPKPIIIVEEPPPKRMDVQNLQTVKPAMMTEALEDRDPNHLNQHVQIVWDDIIGEPEGARSPECAWRLSNICFKNSRNWCYTLLAVIFAPPCALLLGCGFACLAFEQIWCTGPCLRCAKIYFASIRTMVQSCMAATVVPTAEAVGHLCRHIRVNFRRDAPDEQDLLVV